MREGVALWPLLGLSCISEIRHTCRQFAAGQFATPVGGCGQKLRIAPRGFGHVRIIGGPFLATGQHGNLHFFHTAHTDLCHAGDGDGHAGFVHVDYAPVPTATGST